jgi:peroxiredoxin
MKHYLRVLLVCGLTGILLCGCSRQDSDVESSAGAAPEFALKDVDGTVYRLSDFRGNVVILNFFATWCGPCRQEIPDLVKLYQGFAEHGLRIIGVSMDEGGADVLKPFIRQYNMTYPVVLATRQMVLDYGGVQGIPNTFLIDRKGLISENFMGLVPGYQVESSVRRLLKKRG